MAETTEFLRAGEPDFAVPPGETILEFLEELGMSQRELAARLDVTPKHVNQLVQGLASLTPEIARRLELVTGMPAKLWNRLEADYQTTQTRLRSREDLESLASWVAEFPLKELVRRKILPHAPGDMTSRVQQMLSFFGVCDESGYREIYQRPAVDFRQSHAREIDPAAVAVWLRLCEVAAQGRKCRPFDKAGLESELPRLRHLTVDPLSASIPLLRDVCARHGVAVVIVPEVKGARVSGATRWLNPEKAMLALSGRYKTDDQFWFTFFHEIGHILRHGKKEVWIESEETREDPKEAEADAFSRDLLIRPADARRLPTLKTLDSIVAYAASIDVSPGIVMGRLHRDGIKSWRIGQKLKREVGLDSFADV